MMRTMRASAKWIMGIVAVTFVGWMVFEVGMDISGQGRVSQTNEIASVNGTKITAQAFYAAVRNAQEQQRDAGSPVYTLDEQRELQDQVLESLVQQVLIEDEHRRRGIRVSDDELRQVVEATPLPGMQQEPTFQTDGQFDLSKYQRWLHIQPVEVQVAIEAQFRQMMLEAKLQERLTVDVFVPDAKLWRLFRDRYDSVAGKILTILPQAVVRDDEVEVTDQEIEAYYRAHLENYRRPAQVQLSYVAVPRVPDAADSAAALERANSLLAELRGGADFAAVAARESADSGSRQSGGDLGEVPVGTHVAPFADAAMALRPGRISEPVLTAFGYHLIRLSSRTDTTYHASHILIPIELQGNHLLEVESLGDSLDLYAAEQEDPTSLDSAAAILGFPVERAAPLIRGDRLRLGRYVIPDVGVWAFEALEGETSHVIETDHAYYVFRVDRITPEGVAPLEEVIEAVTYETTSEKKSERAAQIAAEIDADLRSGTPFENVGVRHGLRPRTLEPFTRTLPNALLANEPEVVGVAFGLDVGERSGPIKTDRAIYFLESTSRHPADSSTFAEQVGDLRQRIILDSQQLRVRLIVAALRDAAVVRDRREEQAQGQRAAAQSPYGSNPVGY